MRIQSAILRNYRIHGQIKVEFDPKLTLITGPNESGKSTLVEGIHRGLFFKSGAGGKDVREKMNSAKGGIPEVELLLKFGDKDAAVRKIFRTSRDECSIQLSGEPSLTGEAAEERLSQLLRVSGQIGGNGAEDKMERRWAHLWVWQGKGLSSELPTASVAEQQADLERRLQQQGGAAIMHTHLDTLVVKKILAARDARFTATGSPRAGSDLAKAGEALEQAKRTVAEREMLVGMLDEAANLHSEAKEDITRKERDLDRISQEITAVSQKIDAAELIQRKLEPRKREMDELAQKMDELDSFSLNLTEARKSLAQAEKSMRPIQLEMEKLAGEQNDCEQALQLAQKEFEQALIDLQSIRGWRDALTQQADAIEATLRLEAQRKVQSQVRQRQQELQTVLEEIARAAKVESKDLAALHKLSTQVSTDEAALRTLGARIEVISCHEQVLVDGTSVPAGSSHVITSDASVNIGEVASLRIRPGGETGFVAARAAAEKARLSLVQLLERLGVRNLEEAVAAEERLRTLREQASRKKDDIERLDQDGRIDQIIQDLEHEVAEAGRKATIAAQSLSKNLPSDRAMVRNAIMEAAGQVHAVEARQQVAQLSLTEAKKRHGRIQVERERLNGDFSDLRDAVTRASSRIHTLQESSGTDEERARRKLDLESSWQSAQSEWAELNRQWSVLQPGELLTDRTRLNSALNQTREGITHARQTFAAAQERLRLGGTTDPHGQLESAMADLERAKKRHADLAMHGEALRMLAKIALSVQANIAQEVIQPLEEKARGYLECMFGAGTNLKLEWNPGQGTEGAFTGLTVIRDELGQGNFSFESLSGGTREQVGIAMRFAMAEVLAADHDGTLPIMLDDAFANSDPDRILRLQRMIYRAGERGLQVIVLTCNPQDYSTLGAKEISLSRPTATFFKGAQMNTGNDVVPMDSSPKESGSSEYMDTSDPTEQEERLLNTLEACGGKSGNSSLRQSLGWDDVLYATVKDRMIANGILVAGKGRGGSIRLADLAE